WQSTSLVVARASVQALFARKAAFLRTPKTTEQAAWWEGFRANWAETALALCGVLAFVAGLTRLDTFSGPLLAGLLVFPTLGLIAAPFNSLAAQRAALPPDLRARRRSEWLRDRTVVRGAAAAGGAAAALAVLAAVVAMLVAPSPQLVQPPQLLDPHQNPKIPLPAPAGSPAPSGTPSRVGTPTGTPASGGATPSPTGARTPAPTRTTSGPGTSPSPGG